MNWLSDTQFFEDIKAFLSEPVDLKRLSSESLPAPNPIDWKNGDAFAFPLRSEIAKKYHIENRYAVIWKIYDEAKTWRKQAHIVYLSVCEQDRIPKTCEDMLNLGFIPHQPRLDGSVYEFEFALYIDSLHIISEMQIFKIGNYPGKPQLKSEIKNSSASPGYPIFADYKKDNIYDLERILCVLYKSYGLYT
ncbi:MAG: hypothetical protein II875_13255 [Clostridia bacterium]|nr:hypothetical protein [Clostridia bacterium]